MNNAGGRKPKSSGCGAEADMQGCWTRRVAKAEALVANMSRVHYAATSQAARLQKKTDGTDSGAKPTPMITYKVPARSAQANQPPEIRTSHCRLRSTGSRPAVTKQIGPQTCDRLPRSAPYLHPSNTPPGAPVYPSACIPTGEL